MKFPARTSTFLAILAVLSGVWTSAHAQQDAPKPVITTPQPPADDANRAEKLEKILHDWEQKSSQIKSLSGDLVRTVYDLSSQEERVAKGKFLLVKPNKWRIDLEGEWQRPEARGARIGHDGQPFRLVSDRSERWIYTGDEIVLVDDEKKTFQVIPLPAEIKGTRNREAFGDFHYPFMLFAMTRDDLRRQFEIELSNPKPDVTVLIMRPKSLTDQKSFRKLYVLIDQTTSLPTAIKLFDSTESQEFIYKLDSVRINDVVWKRKYNDSNPFRPDLKGDGYQLTVPLSVLFNAPD